MHAVMTELAWNAAWEVVGLLPGDLTPEQRRDLFRRVYEEILTALQRFDGLRRREWDRLHPRLGSD